MNRPHTLLKSLPAFGRAFLLNRLHPIVLLLFLTALPARAQDTIYSYVVGNWRNGPVVQISPLFGTTGMFSDADLVRWAGMQWPGPFAGVADVDVLRFATPEEGRESRATLRAKYGQRQLEVHMIGAEMMPFTPPRPTPVTGPPQ